MSASLIAARDFSATTVRKLAKAGVRIIGTQLIPGAGNMPWANAETAYKVDDNGCGRVWAFGQVLARAGEA